MFDPDANLERDRRIDEICDQFERELQSGCHPQVEQFLRRAAPDDRSQLAVELLRVALDYSGTQVSGNEPRSQAKAALDSADNGQLSTVSVAADRATTPADRPRTAAPGHAPETGADLPMRRVGDYELLDELGSGGMGTVYRARQASVDRIIALKLLRPDRWPGLSAQQRQVAIERFLRESQAAARREHPHVLTVYDAGCEGTTYYLAMRYVDGGSLADRVRNGPLPSHEAATYLEPVCRALHAVHQANIIHRDLKPSNILVERGTNSPLVGDFGLAKIIDSDQELTLSGDFFGTPSYMSPEQVLHPGRVSVATDVYGVGATLYHLLTGRPPFQTPTAAATLQQVLSQEPVAPRLLNPAIPLDLETITLKCLEKDHRRRYSTALDVAQELQRFLAGQPIVARPLRWDQKAWRWCTRHRPVAGLLASLAATLLIFASVTTWLYLNERSSRAIAEQATRAANRQLADVYLQRAALDDPLPRTASLPWLVEALRLETGDAEREFATRVRIGRALATTPRLERSVAHEAPVSDAVFSPDGRRFATADTQGLVQIWSVTDAAQPPLQFRTGSAVTCVRFSPGGDHLAVGGADGSVTIFMTSPGKQQLEVPGHSGSVTAIDFSPDGMRLLTSSADGTATIWDLSHDRLAVPPIQHAGPVYAASFSPQGDQLVIACDDGRAYLHDSTTGERAQTTAPSASALRIARFHPRTPLLLTAGTRDGATVHHLRENQSRSLGDGPHSRVVDAVFSREGEVCLVAEAGGDVVVFNPQDAELPTRHIHAEKPIAAAALSPDGSWFTIAHDDSGLELWETASLRRTASLVTSRPIRLMRIAPQSDRCLVVADTNVAVWGPAVIEHEPMTSTPTVLNRALYHGDGTRLETVERDCNLVIRDADAPLGQPVATFKLPYPIKQSCYAAGNGRWAIADDHGHVYLGQIGDIANRQIDATSLAPLAVLALDHAGKRLAIIGQLGQAWIVSLDDAELARESCTLVPSVKWASFGYDGRTLSVTGGEQRAFLQLDSTEPARLTANAARVVVTRQVGDRVALGQADGVVAMIDLATGNQTSESITVRVIPDELVFERLSDRMAVIAAREVRVWQVSTRKPVSPTLEHATSIVAATFCHAGRLLATATVDGDIWVWHVASGRPVCRLTPNAGQTLACSFLDKQEQLEVVFSSGLIARYALPFEKSALTDLQRFSIWITGCRVDNTGSLVPASPTEQSESQSTSKTTLPVVSPIIKPAE